MSLPAVSGITIPVLSGSHVWTREHFANRPDIEFLRDSVTGIKVYANQTFHKWAGSGTAVVWPVSGVPSGTSIFNASGLMLNNSGVVVSGPSISGIVIAH